MGGHTGLDRFDAVRGPIGCELDALENDDLALDLETGASSEASALMVR